MPLWSAPTTSPADRVATTHQELTGKTPRQIADAPATWVLIGENVDHYGGVTIVGLSDLRAAVAYSERDDNTIRVTFRTANSTELNDDTTLDAVAELANSRHANPDADEEPVTEELGIAIRFGGIVNTLMSRQMLSRDTPGLDITVESDIPLGAGLGAMYAADAALALALLADNDDINEAPLRTRIAEVCTQSVDQYSSMPVLRARHTAALRGVGETISVIDYADGSVTQAPHPQRAGVEVFAVAKTLGKADDSQAKLIADRRAFITKVCQNFGTESLRSIPDSTARAVAWLEAVRQVKGTDGLPSVEEAKGWLEFSENETLRSMAVAKALRSRNTNDLFHLLNTPNHTHGLDTPDDIVQLMPLRGAVAARPAAAGMSQAVIAFVPLQKAHNFGADLAEDGFHVFSIARGKVAGLVDKR
ncbi:galactokinase [Corynebacterium cystitidis]|uniref:galactokinase n=1 Tax=Corynebacterium cystitidis TaxID=35757 RepID=UPI00211E274B|nr:galactokinase [Corynebacterium cystitidis]